MSATITSVEPVEFSITELTSSNEFVKQRRQVEILPTESVTYGSTNSTYRMTFNLSGSNREFLDGINSYIRCELKVDGASATANTTYTRFLDEGGIHSLIKRVTVKLRNGTIISDTDDYNKLYAILSNVTHSKAHIDSVEGMQSGDSVGYLHYLDVDQPYPTGTDDSNIVVADEAKLDTAVLRPSNREVFADGQTRIVSFKLMDNFLNHLKYIPLNMMGQLQLVIEWERPGIGLFAKKRLNADGSVSAAVDADTLAYTITAPRFVANLVEPEQSILDKWNKAFFNGGINLNYQSYKRFKNRVATGNSISAELQLSAKSVRHILAVMMMDASFQESNASKCFPSNSVFRKFGLTKYSFRSGGVRMPDHGPVDTQGAFSAEAFSQLLLAMNNHNNSAKDTRLSLLDWRDDVAHRFHGSGVDFVDSRKFIVGVDCTRQDDFTGLDTTGNPIQVEFDMVNGANEAVNLLCYICHDSILTLVDGSSGIVRS
jgi:hypothetical protein